MSLRLRLVIAFAAVAIATAAVVAAATPHIVGQGFADLERELESTPRPTAAGQPAQPSGDSEDGAERDAEQAALASDIQQNTTSSVILVAAGAAIIASLAGFLVTRQLTAPLGRLEDAAGAVARGDLGRRTGLAARSDEFGQLGRSFDAMASELERAEEARRRFLQDVAHELRTPLTVIDATASAMLDGVYEPERRHLDTIRDQARVLARIVDDLRTIGLAEVGRLPLDVQPVDVATVLASAVAGFEARAAAASVRLLVDAPAGVSASADLSRLRQILGGLVDNALRYTSAGGTVRLVASARGSAPAAVRIAVEDSGTGIPAADLPHVFERFYQADPSHSRRSGTSGLGLSIVRALVEAQGGHVGAENRAEGGARIWFELPVAS